MKRKLVAVKLTKANEAQLIALQEMGFGNQSDVIRTALDRMYQEEIGKMEKETLKSVLLALGTTPITYVGSIYGDDGTPSDDPGRTLPAIEWLENILGMFGSDADYLFIEHPSNVWTEQDGFYMEGGNICFHGSDHSTECVFEL